MENNIWVQRRSEKNFKKKCKFALYEGISSSKGKVHKWSEVYWTQDNEHSCAKIDKETITWVIPEDCQISGFCITHDDKGTLLVQSLRSSGVFLHQGEEVIVDISGLHLVP